MIAVAKQQVPRPIGPYRRPKPDLYTFMLIAAFIALLVAIAALWAHMADYNYEIKGGPSVQTPVAAPAAVTVATAQLPVQRTASDLNGPGSARVSALG